MMGEPQIESIVVNDGSNQRSMVTSLTVTFDQPYSGGVTLQVQARCIEHPDVESAKSASKIVIISP